MKKKVEFATSSDSIQTLSYYLVIILIIFRRKWSKPQSVFGRLGASMSYMLHNVRSKLS